MPGSQLGSILAYGPGRCVHASSQHWKAATLLKRAPARTALPRAGAPPPHHHQSASVRCLLGMRKAQKRQRQGQVQGRLPPPTGSPSRGGCECPEGRKATEPHEWQRQV